MFGCAPGTRDLPDVLSGLLIDASIEQEIERHGAGGEGFETCRVSVALQDKTGRMIESEELRVRLNDLTLSTRSAHGSFYERHPFYRLEGASADLPPDTNFQFRLVRADESFEEAGVVRTPRVLSPEQFRFPEMISRQEMVAVEWLDLTEPVELAVFRCHSYVDMHGNTVVVDDTANDPAAIRRTIGPGLLRRPSGRLEIPAEYLADHDERRVCGVGVEISVTHLGQVPERFSRQSSIRATRRLKLQAEFVD